MATLNINRRVNFTYTYGEEEGKQFVEGEFFKGPGMIKLGVSLRVTSESRKEAIDAICRYAKLIGGEFSE